MITAIFSYLIVVDYMFWKMWMPKLVRVGGSSNYISCIY